MRDINFIVINIYISRRQKIKWRLTHHGAPLEQTAAERGWEGGGSVGGRTPIYHKVSIPMVNRNMNRDSTSVGVHRGSTRGLEGGGLGAMEMVKGKKGHFTEFPICSWQRVGKD